MKLGIIAGSLVAGTMALVLVAFTAVPAAAPARVRSASQAFKAMHEARDGSTALWQVELSSPPTADGTSVAVLEREEAAFHAAASKAGIDYVERRRFQSLWNGLTVSMRTDAVSRVRALAGVKGVYPVVRVIPLAGQPQTGGQAQTGADVVRALGLTGAGVHVAVLDSGIDYRHPDLGGCFGDGCRVTRGFDFVDNDRNPDDCNGHGTHVAGIIGAKGGITGVAPGVTFGAYRVFGCTGSSDTDTVLAAMERILKDGADVLNMSLGPDMDLPFAFQWAQSPVGQAEDRLVKKGIVVVGAIGDRGADGLYAVGAPGVASKVIGVASFENGSTDIPLFTISPDNRQVEYQAVIGSPAIPTDGTLSMARTGTAASASDACVALASGSLAGKVALIRRGGCMFRVKADNAAAAGAVGVVFYNNVPGRITPTAMVTGSPAVSIPLVQITAADGEAIDARLAAGPVTMTWTRQVHTEPSSAFGAGLISSFSSFGLAPDLSVKPDLGAPGGQIRSTLPIAQGSYGVRSGSSMAAAHTAGAVALLIEARRKNGWGRDDKDDKDGNDGDNDEDSDGAGGAGGASWARTLLLNSAEPKLWSDGPSYGLLDHVHRQGAGMLRVDRAYAALAGVHVSPASLALGESEAGPATRRLKITNHGRSRVIYNLSQVAALATGPGTFDLVYFIHTPTVLFSAPAVTLSAGGSATIDVTITADPTLPDQSLYGGYLVLTPRGAGAALRVPYAGITGDYQSINAINPGMPPSVAKRVGSAYVNQPGGATFTMAGGDVPMIRVHLDHPVRRLQMEVFDVKTGKSEKFAVDTEYLGRNRTKTETRDFLWDGTTMEQPGERPRALKNGAYRIELKVLKALGDPRNLAHFERWTSPQITIARP